MHEQQRAAVPDVLHWDKSESDFSPLHYSNSMSNDVVPKVTLSKVNLMAKALTSCTKIL